MNPRTDSASFATVRKPRLSLFFATVGGAGCLPKAPGTWGSLIGVAIYWAMASMWNLIGGFGMDMPVVNSRFAHVLPSPKLIASAVWFFIYHIDFFFGVTIALLGLVAAHRVARWSARKDPRFVVIDEVSGQFFTYLFGLAPANWKYLALGFILFRVFDIWKPFPARQAESLPGGLGIMADDWVAAIYAAIGIWIARAMGL